VRILFLNQYFPPDPAPTGALFAEIANALQARGHEVRFIDAGQEYRSGQGKPGRMRRELFALIRMLWRGMQEPRPDVVVSGTSPPCLAFIAQLIALRHGARSVHWCMDLYPEIAVSLGEVKKGWLSRIIAGVLGWSYRRTSTVVALDTDMASRLRAHGVSSQIIRPWVMNWRELSPPQVPTTATHWTWLYSGNLGRAHDWQTLLDAQSILEKEDRDIALIFQGGGPSWNSVRSHADTLGLKRIEWRPYAPESELQSSLLQAQCLIVTQRLEVQGMLWPSKLALMLALPRPILFVGPIDGDIGRTLRALPHAGVFAPGDARGVADWLVETKEGGSPHFVGNVIDPKAHRSACLDQWIRIVESCSPAISD
jgi:colanic acid biosynthesis glycosyl transferase WcaI